MDGVLVGHDVDLQVECISISPFPAVFCMGSTYDLEGVGDNADSHKLLSVVATVHHQGVGETLDDWALCLSESLLGISTGGMGDVDWGADLDVIAVGYRVSQNFVGRPISQSRRCAFAPNSLPCAAFQLYQKRLLTSKRYL